MAAVPAAGPPPAQGTAPAAEALIAQRAARPFAERCAQLAAFLGTRPGAGRDSAQRKYFDIMEFAAAAPPLPPWERAAPTRVRGCLSQTFLDAAADSSGRLRLRAHSDALISKGLCGLLCWLYDGEEPCAVARHVVAADYWTRLGLSDALSMGRQAGFDSMRETLARRALLRCAESLRPAQRPPAAA
eukprot:TRINITY_DN45980_c0_g1_i1.p1 TRINITY_DN45980_c0_g1~~TRINITY_DN45980_c0_g1_i1.p1  ORF type:complete len:211 (+),score=61.22 TRINITY_DN45980_c0_g1_i1:73-633(+)